MKKQNKLWPVQTNICSHRVTPAIINCHLLKCPDKSTCCSTTTLFLNNNTVEQFQNPKQDNPDCSRGLFHPGGLTWKAFPDKVIFTSDYLKFEQLHCLFWVMSSPPPLNDHKLTFPKSIVLCCPRVQPPPSPPWHRPALHVLRDSKSYAWLPLRLFLEGKRNVSAAVLIRTNNGSSTYFA